MEELPELKTHINKGNYAEALNLIGETEEMSRDDKIGRIYMGGHFESNMEASGSRKSVRQTR